MKIIRRSKFSLLLILIGIRSLSLIAGEDHSLKRKVEDIVCFEQEGREDLNVSSKISKTEELFFPEKPLQDISYLERISPIFLRDISHFLSKNDLLSLRTVNKRIQTPITKIIVDRLNRFPYKTLYSINGLTPEDAVDNQIETLKQKLNWLNSSDFIKEIRKTLTLKTSIDYHKIDHIERIDFFSNLPNFISSHIIIEDRYRQKETIKIPNKKLFIKAKKISLRYGYDKIVKKEESDNISEIGAMFPTLTTLCLSMPSYLYFKQFFDPEQVRKTHSTSFTEIFFIIRKLTIQQDADLFSKGDDIQNNNAYNILPLLIEDLKTLIFQRKTLNIENLTLQIINNDLEGSRQSVCYYDESFLNPSASSSFFHLIQLMPHLKKIKLLGCFDTDFEDLLKQLSVYPIPNLKQITYLKRTDSTKKYLNIHYLGNFINAHPGLEKVKLSGNFFPITSFQNLSNIEESRRLLKKEPCVKAMTYEAMFFPDFQEILKETSYYTEENEPQITTQSLADFLNLKNTKLVTLIHVPSNTFSMLQKYKEAESALPEADRFFKNNDNKTLKTSINIPIQAYNHKKYLTGA